MKNFPANIEVCDGYYALTLFHPDGSGAICAQVQIPVSEGGLTPIMVRASEVAGQMKDGDEAERTEEAFAVLRPAGE